MKIEFDEDGKAKPEPLKSGRVIEDLLRVQIMSDDLILVFHLEHLVFRDGNLKLLGSCSWEEVVGSPVGKLCTHGATIGHKDHAIKNNIMIFTMSYNDHDKIECKSVYNQRRMVTTHDGEAYYIMRMQASEDPMDGLDPLNQATESMIFKDELPMAPIEYAPNKLFITGTPTHMYLVDDWRAESVTAIVDNHPANTFKT